MRPPHEDGALGADRLLQGLWIDGMAVLFGKESIEFWSQTASADLPIKALQNMVIEEGIKVLIFATIASVILILVHLL